MQCFAHHYDTPNSPFSSLRTPPFFVIPDLIRNPAFLSLPEAEASPRPSVRTICGRSSERKWIHAEGAEKEIEARRDDPGRRPIFLRASGTEA